MAHHLQNIPGNDSPVITFRAWLAGALIAAALCLGFTIVSSGTSLIVTFVPGVVIALVIFSDLARCRTPLPPATSALPIYYFALAWQGLHFAEELHMEFWRLFPELYGGNAYSLQVFTWFNMAAYGVFGIAAVGPTMKGLTPFYLPALFFTVYGTVGNGIAHVIWSFMVGGYFPGLYTGIGHLIIGPILVRIMWPGRRAAIAWTCLGLMTIMTPLLILAASP